MHVFSPVVFLKVDKILLHSVILAFHYLIVYSSNNVIIAFNKICLTWVFNSIRLEQLLMRGINDRLYMDMNVQLLAALGRNVLLLSNWLVLQIKAIYQFFLINDWSSWAFPPLGCWKIWKEILLYLLLVEECCPSSFLPSPFFFAETNFLLDP